MIDRHGCNFLVSVRPLAGIIRIRIHTVHVWIVLVVQYGRGAVENIDSARVLKSSLVERQKYRRLRADPVVDVNLL